MKYEKMLDSAPTISILESFTKAIAKINNYSKIICSISGGSDSDVLLDLCHTIDVDKKIHYVFFDTGLEFTATKDHISSLEKKYGINIERIKALKPIPLCCKEYGQPFLSKQVSEWISRLQMHSFKWEDDTLENLLQKYPMCKAALRWWCNDYPKNENGSESRFNINYNQFLKEFMIENPPKFKISNKCCKYAKKKVAEKAKKDGNYDLSIYGVRKSEGGARASAYKTCFSSLNGDCDEFRPIFWLKNADKTAYEETYNISHSRCYSEYGMKRTGCAGCPFARNFEQELEIMKKYEPKLYKAAQNIFGDSYEYMRKYREYINKKRRESK